LALFIIAHYLANVKTFLEIFCQLNVKPKKKTHNNIFVFKHTIFVLH